MSFRLRIYHPDVGIYIYLSQIPLSVLAKFGINITDTFHMEDPDPTFWNTKFWTAVFAYRLPNLEKRIPKFQTLYFGFHIPITFFRIMRSRFHIFDCMFRFPYSILYTTDYTFPITYVASHIPNSTFQIPNFGFCIQYPMFPLLHHTF